jgi:glutaredoxin-like protein
MSIIPSDVLQQVKDALQGMQKPVKILVFSQAEGAAEECSMCSETRDMIEDIAGLSDLIQVEAYDLDRDAQAAAQYHIDKAPAVAVLEGGVPGKDFGIRLYGIPSGYEFSSLISDILLVSGGKPGLDDKTIQQLQKLEKPVHIQVFVTPTCPYCPQAVVLAHRLALASDKITADMVESMEFPQLAERYQVYGVPRTVIDDVIHIEGAVPEKMLVAELMKVLDTDLMHKLQQEWSVGLN